MTAERLDAPRDGAIDAVKALAIVGVLCIHASAPGFSQFAVGSFSWYVSLFWGTVLRAAVPLFFMCSGALLLHPDKKIPIKSVYTKYLLRIVLALVFWAAAYEIFDIILKLRAAGTVSWNDFCVAFKNLVFFKHHFHLYYLHIMIIVYIFLPITRIVVKGATKRQLQYALILWAVFGILYPFARTYYPFNMLSGIPAQFTINLTYAAIGYGVLGYYLKKYPMSSRASLLYFVGFLLAFCGTAVSSIIAGKPVTTYLEGMSPGVALMAAGIYIGAIALFKNRRAGTALKKIALASFCIYLVHDFFNIALRGLGFTVFKLT
ncbi:MAG: acyltransferase family protein, partial [Clostridia bacterium]